MLGQRAVDPMHQFRTPGTTLKTRKENGHPCAMPRTAVKDARAKALFHPDSLHAQSVLKDAGPSKPPLTLFNPPITPATHPLGDKTPFPNRNRSQLDQHENSPLPPSYGKLLLQKPGGPKGEPPIRLSLRPSSTRKSLRAPRTSGSGGRLQHITNAFETPITRGDHWNVHDSSFELELNAPQLVQEEPSIEEEDYDEIEYMPPTAIVPAYEPLDELPNYKELGLALKKAALLYPAEDLSMADFDLTPSEEQELLRAGGFSPTHRPLLDLPELDDDDPLSPPKIKKEPTKPVALTRQPGPGHQRSRSVVAVAPSLRGTATTVGERSARTTVQMPHAGPLKQSSTVRATTTSMRTAAKATGTARSRPASTTTTVTTARTAPPTRTRLAAPVPAFTASGRQLGTPSGPQVSSNLRPTPRRFLLDGAARTKSISTKAAASEDLLEVAPAVTEMDDFLFVI